MQNPGPRDKPQLKCTSATLARSVALLWRHAGAKGPRSTRRDAYLVAAGFGLVADPGTAGFGALSAS
jgi:hypothetical protein